MNELADPAKLPGYRRRIMVQPGQGAVVASLEDDYHRMSVTLEHDGETVSAIVPVMERAPWTTCPGAVARLQETFAGRPLSEIEARREKKQNCTHLHDLAVLAAAHACDAGPLGYDVFASDPVGGTRILEIRRWDGWTMRWIERDDILAAPPDIAGRTLFTLRDWIAALPEAEREAARLLQWASIVAHGRRLPREHMGIAGEMPANCYTFQPERIATARRIGKTIDFSKETAAPLDGLEARKSPV